ncbi:MAG: DEAD/DEAH box helicase [Planctomycetia bacterium]|nr:DEAD/DEAH box helicase [Planctomycetia bacterium]
MSFSEVGLSESVVRAVTAAGYTVPTPIQAQSIPIVISGRDLLGVAQTGTGKTAAFALPIIHRLLQERPAQTESNATVPRAVSEQSATGSNDRRSNFQRDDSRNMADRNVRPAANARKIRVLVLSPTRELACQIGDSFAKYSAGTPLRHTTVFGGVSQFHQVKALRHGVDILVATPGRLMDLREQGFIDLSHVQIFVLDEADRMLDMGFLPVVRRIAEMLPIVRQTLFFSATMPPEVRSLADTILKDPASVEISPVATTADNIEQSVYLVEKADKIRLLRHFLKQPEVARTLVFIKTKHAADRVADQLDASGFRVEAIHGNRSQSQRQRALDSFKCGRSTVLIATDLAARGIDVDGITHVINFDLPMEIDNYVHRIGRTARAGASGVAITFCSGEERGRLRAIERLIRQRLEVRNDLPKFVAEAAPQRSSNHGGNGPVANGTRSRRPDENRAEFADNFAEGLDEGAEMSEEEIVIARRREADSVSQRGRSTLRPVGTERPTQSFRNQGGSQENAPRHGNGPRGPRRFGKSSGNGGRNGGGGKPHRPFASSTR